MTFETKAKRLRSLYFRARYGLSVARTAFGLSQGGGGNAPRAILVVSGGSSGSHLLARLLANYKPLVAGPEINIASRPDLFSPATFHGALMKGLTRRDPIGPAMTLSTGRVFHPCPPMVLTNGEAYGFPGPEDWVPLIREVDNWHEMVALVLNRCEKIGKVDPGSLLLEHSPSASLSVETFLRHYPNGRVIHVVRDPRDCIASMMERRRRAVFFDGIKNEENLHITTSQWLLLTACALKGEGMPGYLRISYEDLVRNTDAVLSRVLSHLGVSGVEKRETPSKLISYLGAQPGWRNSPLGEIKSSSIGRHKEDLSQAQLDALEQTVVEDESLGIACRAKDMIDRFKA